MGITGRLMVGGEWGVSLEWIDEKHRLVESQLTVVV